MPIMYNAYGSLTALDVWRILEGMYPVMVNRGVGGGGSTTVLNIAGVRGCIVAIGCTGTPVDCSITIDGAGPYSLRAQQNQTIPIVAAFSNTCRVDFINGGGACTGWVSYRRE